MSQANDPIRAVILRLLQEAGDSKSIGPTDVARSLAGKDEKEWSKLMKPIREAAVELANEGELVILRKGKPVDPGDFKGVYRLGRVG